MGRRLGLCSSWFGFAGLLWGCGSGTLSDGKPLLLDQACRDLQQAACAAFQRCAPDNFGSAYPDLASCVSIRTADCVERRGAPGNSVTPDGVEACAHATSKLTCDAVMASEFGNTQSDPACVWQGTLAEGDACIASSQCATGTCSFYDRDACGTCVTRADSSCIVDSECLVGSRCINGLCVGGGQLGAACGGASVCATDLTCRDGQCAPLAKLGEACVASGSGGCGPGLWCNYVTLQCGHSVLLPGTGTEGCGIVSNGSNVLCPAGKQCLPDAASGTNHCVPAAPEGDPCSYQIECGVGLGCYESTCTRLRADACAAPGTSANPQYPALLPSVPQAKASTTSMLLTTPKVVLITFAGDSRADTLEAYVQALGTSAYWHSTTSEYGVGAFNALSPIRVAEVPPTTIADADVTTWLADKLTSDARFPASDGLTLYVVVYPSNVAVTLPGPSSEVGRSCFDFGGYHNSFTGPGGTLTPYAVIPDCHFGDTEGAISHEVVEAATDPFPNSVTLAVVDGLGYATIDPAHLAWALPSAGGAELADLCEWQPLVSFQDPEVGGTVQRTWSNAAMAGFHQPCVPARSAVYFNSVPHFDDVVSVLNNGMLTRTRGISIPVGQSKTVPVDLLSDGPTDGPWRVSAYDLKEWTHAFDYTAGVEPTLRFDFDRQSGVNGDTLQMTVTVLKQDADYRAEPFVLVSRRARDTNVWVGVVGQP
jgi:hypothetical protein